ncbi:MAG TPA: hypothetical protein VFT74_03020 [Isosphaeraceae bacterium]|nr:hypothetical protein [Isosphaeraceae bacterium]
MATASRNQDRVEVLKALMDRLCASDLTLAESKDLCGRLSGMLADADLVSGASGSRPSRAPVETRHAWRAVS